MLVTDFVRWLQDRRRDADRPLAQAEIARQTKISQAWINKIAMGGSVRFPDPDIVHRLFNAYPGEWAVYVREHPAVQQELQRLFDWLFVVGRPDDCPLAPQLEEALGHLRVILDRDPRQGKLFIDQLQAQADYLRRSPSAKRRGARPTRRKGRPRRR